MVAACFAFPSFGERNYAAGNYVDKMNCPVHEGAGHSFGQVLSAAPPPK